MENQLDHKVKVIRSDNGTEFKNSVMNQLCEMNGIKREFSVARTTQQNGVAKKRNRILIEAARTILVDSKLPTTFWAEEVNNACYVLNKAVDGKAVEGLAFCSGFFVKSMSYVPVAAGNKTNGIAGTKDNIVAGQAQDKNEALDKSGKHDQEARSESERLNQREMQTEHTNSSNGINTISTPVSTVGPSFDTAVPSTPVNTVGPSVSTANESEEQLFERFSPFKNAFTLPPVPNISSMVLLGIVGNCFMMLKCGRRDHPEDQVIGSLKTPVQTRHMTKITEEHGLFSSVHKLRRTNHKDFQNCLFACFLSQMEPKKPVQALKDPSWVEAMQDELLQFKLLKVWTLVDLPRDKWAIGTKWVFRNKKDERGIVVKNKLVWMLRFTKMDVKSAFSYGKIEEEVYVCQPPSFEDPHFPDKVYKVEKALYGLHQAPRAWYETLSTYLLDNGFPRGQIDKTLFIKRHKELSASTDCMTLIETNKHGKREEAEDVDVHLYRLMIGSLMYLTSSRPDIMFTFGYLEIQHLIGSFSDSDYAELVLTGNPNQEVLWIQNQMLDYGFNFINTKIYIDNESTICIVKNLMSHSKTKHIEIRHHFIRHSYEKKLIQVFKIHTDQNVADLLTKAFDASRLRYVCFGKSKEVGTPRYLSLVVPLKKVGDEAVHKELGDRMERAATTASSLEAEQDSGSGPRCQDTILGDVDAQTRFETTSKQFNDPPLSKVNTFRSGEDSMQLMELMAHCTKLCEFVRKKNREKCHNEDGVHAITATIDGRDKIITEAFIRRHLKLQDSEGLSSFPNAEIFEQLARMGYATTSDSLTFLKGYFAP
ncbi:putative ribonuclease H-like domain-containing protein [Tanacetum coccineum]